MDYHGGERGGAKGYQKTRGKRCYLLDGRHRMRHDDRRSRRTILSSKCTTILFTFRLVTVGPDLIHL